MTRDTTHDTHRPPTAARRRTARTAALAAFLTLALAPGAAAQFVEPEVTVLATHVAEAAGDGFGWVGEAIGDIDGDGAPDYIIGAIRNQDGGFLAGKAYVYSGATGTLLATHTGNALERLGYSVNGGGDFDGDGVPDYAIGAPGVGSNPARVLMISGADHGVLHQIDDGPGTFLGFDINLAGDVDGDGRTDLIVGAPLVGGFTGRVDVYSGATGALIWSAPSPTPGGALGTAVSGLADYDGDGVPEQVAGAGGGGVATGPGRVPIGEAFVLDGATGTPVRHLQPNGSGFSFGIFFAHDAGDVDADGVTDIYISDFGDQKGGRGYVFSGATDERLRLFNAETPSDGLGMGRGAGDVDGDGHADLLIGAYLSSAGGFQAGKCYLFSGKNGQTLRTFTATLPNAQVGFDVVTLGDVTGDGVTDFLLTGNDVSYVVEGL